MKLYGYKLFSLFYYIFCMFPVDMHRVFCIMTHDGSDDSNVGMVVQELKKRDSRYRFYYMKKDNKSFRHIVSFFIVKPYQMARAGYILEDNIFLPMAYMKFRKSVKVIQLWHGTGTIKKFGQDSNTGELAELEKSADNTITHLIVNSDGIKEQYGRAFGVSGDRVYAFGLPRTDTLFNKNKLESGAADFYKEYPEIINRKIILYAPTFRDLEVSNPKLQLDIDMLLDSISEEYLLMIKLHPFVASAFTMDKTYEKKFKGRFFNMSLYREINTLLYVSDILITDYSSVIFEYCLQKKPMIFYAYDLEEFSERGRGFYEDYNSFVPGPVVTDTKAISDLINEGAYDYEKIDEFVKKHYKYFDGRSTERLVNNIFDV